MKSIDMKRTGVSLADELAELGAVLEAVGVLANLISRDNLPDPESSTRVPKLVIAVVELALNRVRLLRKVVLQQADVSLLISGKNSRDRISKGEDPDVLLPIKRGR